MIQLQYYPSLYVSKSISAKKLDKIKRYLVSRPLRANVYLITTARNGIDQLEIYSAKLLVQRYYQSNPPYVVGITHTYEEALKMIVQIVQECLDARGDCALREYLKC